MDREHRVIVVAFVIIAVIAIYIYIPVPTLAFLPDEDLVYGDPGGPFSLPLVGDWMPVETDGA